MTRVLRYFHQDPIKTASLSSTSTTTTIVNLDSKQDKIKGKSLSTNDFTDIYKQKLKDIEDKAEVNVQADWNTTDTEDDSYIKNKPSSLPASDVYDWAKQETKPSYNLDEVLDGSLRKLSDYIPVSLKGIYGGVATLGANDGKVPESQLPSYVDDVLEFSDSSYFPQTGESGKIYVDIQTNLTYRWTGTQYTEISPSIALGETSSTAYAGDKGKALKDAYEAHASDTTIHITAAERAVWNAKQDAISDLETIRSNASTAYGWGDHSLAGYLTSVDIADMATKTWVGLQGYTTNTGTVTSVAMTVPTGLSVSGSPITTNGTLAITFASGYSIPTTTKLSNWDTAYGWGDHSLAGYQMAISDLATIRSRADEGHTAYGWGDHSQQGYVKSSGVTSVAMTVPTGLSISGSPITSTGTLALSFANGYSIPTDAKQSNWDTAYSWGNHANEGYLKSITSQMVTNALGYTPPTQDTNTWRPITDTYTGSDTGTSVSLKGTNDLYNALVNGYASSAGNADTVDGEHSNAFLHLIGGTMTGNVIFSGDNKIEWNRNTDGAGIRFKNTDNADSDSYMSFYTLDDYNEYFKFSHFGYNEDELEWFTIKSDGARVLGNTVWHAGNDGSGSGLDADMLDTKHASDFMARVIHYSMTGDIPTDLEDGMHRIHRPGVEYSSILAMHDYYGSYFQLYVHPTDGYDESIQFRSNNTGGVFRTIIDSNNIGSQSVNYANSAGNADTVDGYHASNLVFEYNSNLTGNDKIYDVPAYSVFSGYAISDAPANTGLITGIALAQNHNNSHYQSYLITDGGTWWCTADYENGSMKNWKTILTSANYSGYALPLSGGTLTSSVNNVLVLNSTNSYETGILILRNGTPKGWIGYADSVGTYIYNASRGGYLAYRDDGILSFEGLLVLHTGNIASNISRFVDYTHLAPYYYDENVGTKFYWYRIPKPPSEQIRWYDIYIQGDVNYPRFGHWNLLVGNFDNSTTFNYVLMNLCRTDDTEIYISSDYNYVYIQAFAAWTCGLYIKSLNGTSALDIDTNPVAYADFGTVAGFTPASGYTFRNKAAIRTNSSGVIDINRTYIESDNFLGNASSATQLQTTRYIWGQSFNGTADITGAMSNVTNIDSTLYFDTTNSHVGIGTTSPTEKLHVYDGNVAIHGKSVGNTSILHELDALVIAPKPSRSTTSNIYYPGIAFNHMYLYNATTTYNNAAQGWIGLRLHSTPGSELSYLVFATKPGIGVSDSGDDRPLERMCITPDGYIGIGTQTPSTKLHVNGSVKAEDWVSAKCIEFTSIGSSEGYGGYIDFHYNGSSADYTSRIIEDLQGRISVNNSKFYNSAIVTSKVLTYLFGPDVVDSPNDAWSDGTWSHPWYSYDVSHDLTPTQTSNMYSYLNEASYHTTISDYFGMVLRTNAGLIRLRFDGTFFIENSQYTNKIEFYNNNVESVLAFIDRTGGTYFGLRYGNGATTSGDYLTVGDQDRNTYLRGRDIYIYPDTGGIVGFFSGNEGYNGVGTSSPSYKLQVNGACAASSFPNTSDLRLKRVYTDWYPTIELIAEAPIFTFKWKDNTFDDDIHIGSSALYWQDVAPELVTTAKDDIGTLSLQYDVLGLASSVTVAKEVIKLQRELEDTKEELELLRAQIAELKLLLK